MSTAPRHHGKSKFALNSWNGPITLRIYDATKRMITLVALDWNSNIVSVDINVD
jgi:hypothetical protein